MASNIVHPSTMGVRVGEVIPDVPYNELVITSPDLEENRAPATVVYAEECTIVFTESKITDFNEKLERIEEDGRKFGDAVKSYTQLQQLYRREPINENEYTHQIRILLKYARDAIKYVQVIAVQFEEGGPAFWYVLFNCDPGNPRNIREFAYMDLPVKNAARGFWYPTFVDDHSVGFNYTPGTMTAIHTWITQGGLARYIRNTKSIKEFLMNPLVDKLELYKYFLGQGRTHFGLFMKNSRPLGQDTVVYRASPYYKNVHQNFMTDAIIGTTTDFKKTENFHAGNISLVKKIVIPANVPVFDLRIWNPREDEILLVPPIFLRIVKRGENDPVGEENVNEYVLSRFRKGGMRMRMVTRIKKRRRIRKTQKKLK